MLLSEFIEKVNERLDTIPGEKSVIKPSGFYGYHIGEDSPEYLCRVLMVGETKYHLVVDDDLTIDEDFDPDAPLEVYKWYVPGVRSYHRLEELIEVIYNLVKNNKHRS